MIGSLKSHQGALYIDFIKKVAIEEVNLEIHFRKGHNCCCDKKRCIIIGELYIFKSIYLWKFREKFHASS